VREDDGRALCRVVFATTLPAVIARAFATLAFDAGALAVACASATYGTLAFAFAFVEGKKVARETNARASERAAALARAHVGLNLGTFAYPLIDAAHGAAGVASVVVFDVVNQFFLLVVARGMYAADASAGAGGATTNANRFAAAKKVLANPCALAVGIALAHRACTNASMFPAFIDGALETLSKANKPMALLALGALFSPNANAAGDFASIARFLAQRYALAFACASAIVFTFGDVLGATASAVCAMAMCSPAPLLTVSYAMEFGFNVDFAATVVNYANIASSAIVIALAHVSFANSREVGWKLAVMSLGCFALERGARFASRRGEEARAVTTKAFQEQRFGERFGCARLGARTRVASGGEMSMRTRTRASARAVSAAPPQRTPRRAFVSIKTPAMANGWVLRGVLFH